ncbi:MAG TPA: tRNA (N(6)-L-threonylcarbamoyladenosine(37)-C(2))-methylthiotransferase MtaB [Candidatus Binataceae bacterium]|jgi:threonylcarbamoyladenosine tRNA methylthiotransferase MtaB|nr:tRNA (N(6)-L-threonylcarbamoyladenosine(37)-C(2))-methylthiotransferase MtaB [Candidatus Binataceae bacterium]
MRYAITTLGCKVNQYDSGMIEARLGEAGLERCEFDQIADVYVVNTCTVTDRADAESLKLARRARRLNPQARVIMTGCLAQASPEKLAAAQEVDQVVGIARMDDLVRAATQPGVPRVMVSNLRKTKAAIDVRAVVPEGQTRAFLKLQEGCDQFCSFCIVPFSRGTSRSVPPREVIEILDSLHEKGFKEVILSGVHLGGYGKDLSPPATLIGLLEMIAERCPIPRIRLSSIDPEELSDEIIDLVAGTDKFCPHFHLPLQAGDDQILEKMRRRYQIDDYRRRVERILERLPDAAIGTDLIVGFPGETDKHFERYFAFIEALPLAYFHVFPYSVRSGTTAAKFGGRVAASEIKHRAQRMRNLGEIRRRAFGQRFVGTELKVLVEETREPGCQWLRGYSRNYLKVLIQGPDQLKNHEVDVQASAGDGVALVGSLVQPQAANSAGSRN